MKPSLRYTYEFVRAALPMGCQSILEIGCGTGELARLLQDDGFDLVAVDSDPSAVADAQRIGVNAQPSEWPADVGAGFHAVLFTRSLHHIHELDEAVTAAVAAVRRGGRIIVEDFRAEGVRGCSDAWFEALVHKLHSRGSLRHDAQVDAIVERARPAGQEHELHSSDALAAELNRHGAVERADAAYYFRYLEPEFASFNAIDAVLAEELARVAAGEIDALGQRFVLSPDG